MWLGLGILSILNISHSAGFLFLTTAAAAAAVVVVVAAAAAADDDEEYGNWTICHPPAL